MKMAFSRLVASRRSVEMPEVDSDQPSALDAPRPLRRRSGVAIIGTPILRPSDLRSEIAHSRFSSTFVEHPKLGKTPQNQHRTAIARSRTARPIVTRVTSSSR